MMSALIQDLRHSFGTLAGKPGLTAVAVITRALGRATALAGHLPARRAAKLDPMAALRYE